MLSNSPTDFAAKLNPRVKILIAGQSMGTELENDLISAEVTDDIDAPSMVELKFITQDIRTQKITWVDDRRIFFIGQTLQVQMGYDKNLITIIDGEITGLEPEFIQDRTPILGVRGHDLRHRLLRGTQTQSFVKMTDSEIASQIARAKGLYPVVTDSQVKLDYVLQHNQTDWDFLQERASRIGYEVIINDNKLYFKPRQNDQPKILTLTYPNDLLEFLPRLSSLSQIQKVEVKGWNLKEKKAFVSQAGVGKESKMQGTKTGAQTVKEIFTQSNNTTVVTDPVTSKAQADQMALGEFQNSAITYVTAEGVCSGNPQIRAGKVIEIQGVGTSFSGLYYITKAEHKLFIEEDYQTSFTARRTAI